MTQESWTVDDHLRGKPPASVDLFRAFEAMVAGCGSFELSVSKSTVTFKGARRGFAGAHPTRGGLRGYLDLQRAVDDPRITAVAPYTSRLAGSARRGLRRVGPGGLRGRCRRAPAVSGRIR
ncbi:DUF5655 domain-containing protein [Microbacterium sp. NPDC096154]|uniref:DUF5655 domain-containing protein n=1 Tax=Microbacterium sp. NPDC096154 TaxID=3155549 RepID=UPI00332867F3